MSSVQELLSQINAGQAKRTAAPDKRTRQKALAKANKASAPAGDAAPGPSAPSAQAPPPASSAPAPDAPKPTPNLAPTAPASLSPGIAARDAPRQSDSRHPLFKGGHSAPQGQPRANLPPPSAPASSAHQHQRTAALPPSTQPSAAAARAQSMSQLRNSKVAPLGKRQKDVQDFLRTNVGDSFNVAEVQAATGYDLSKDAELLTRLRQPPPNTRVCVVIEEDPIDSSAMRLRYRPRHPGVRDKVTLLNFIREHATGTYREDLEDSYKGVVEDMKALKAEGRIFMIQNPENEQPALFPAELEGVRVDEDVAEDYHKVELPYDVLELQAHVQQAGLRSALASQELKRTAPAALGRGKDGKRQRPRRERAVNINKVTNAHLPSLFAGAAPKSIDER